ncbi:MAG TPA: hypothetical protein VIT90_07310 [Lysobacter sp.]
MIAAETLRRAGFTLAFQSLSPNERAALLALLNRRPLFKWEREALTECTQRSLEAKGLITRDGEQWRVTEKVLARSKQLIAARGLLR